MPRSLMAETPGDSACRGPRLAGGAVAALVLLLGERPAAAARFGIPEAGADPPGWFILTGPQIPTGPGNLSWGDNRHGLDLFAEVTTGQITVELYDPGLVGADANGLDAFYGGTIGQATYRLFDAAGTLLAERSFGSDDAMTNRALVLLHDGPTSPGLHRIEIRMDDTATDDQDINAFGVRVPGHDMFSWHFTGGDLNLSGARITDPLAVFPWLVHSTPTTVTGNPATGVDVATWDLDAPAAPPDVRLETPLGRGAGIVPSPDSGLFVTNLSGIDRGLRDCSDYGVFRLTVANLTARREGGSDAQVFSAQLYDYDAGVTTAEFPIAAGDPRRPIRLYYPRDDGSPPVKESLAQSARVVAGPDPPNPGVTSTVEVSLELRNPTAYDLTAVDLVSHAFADPQLGPPILTSVAPTLSAVVAGREIRVSGSVPAGSSGLVTYELAFTPAALGRTWLTGDGADLQGGALPTQAAYATIFEPAARVGPICMLRIDAVDPTCSASAIIGGARDICEGESVDLSAAASSVTDCPGLLERRWLRDGVEIAPYPAAEILADYPAADALYDLEVRCDAVPACLDTSSVLVRVEPDIPPAPVSASLRVGKVPGAYRFSWTPGPGARDHLRHHDLRSFPRPTSDLVAAEIDGTFDLPRTPPVYFDIDFYRVFAANCAGTEEP